MGVHGLWQLLHPSGRPVTLESLEGKVLAVDVSIWLHQTMKGMRDKDGNPLPNAHLQGLFSRVCKLLFYRIKPIFVFDGDVPSLKKQTLVARRERKAQAERESHEIAQKLLSNLVKSEAVKKVLGDGSSAAPPRVPGVRRGTSLRSDKDIFELAPLPESDNAQLKKNAEAWEEEFEQQENWIRDGLSALSNVNHDSEEFQSMPLEIQHEALNDMKERRKYHSLRQMTRMPEDSDSFSAYQLKKLMKQCNLTTEIDAVRKRMTKKTANDLQLTAETSYTGDEVEARRIVSEDASHYILIKGMSKEKQREQADQYALECKVKKEKEEIWPESTLKSEKTQPAEGRPSSFIKRASFGRRKSKISKPDPKHQGGNSKGKMAPVPGTSVVLDRLVSRTDSDEEIESKDDDGTDSVKEMSSEDEGFIEVAFDPSQVVEEDNLFPASIFSTTAIGNKEEFCVKAVAPLLLEDEPFERSDSLKQSRAAIRDNGKSEKTVEEDEPHLGKKEPSMTSCPQTSKGEETYCRIAPESSDADKRKSVLSEILSQLKRKKEEIDVSEGVDGENSKPEQIASDHSRRNETGKNFAKEETNQVEDNGAIDRRRASNLEQEDEAKTDQRIASTVHHIDSDEDEDLKLAIELSLQTAKGNSEGIEQSWKENNESVKKEDAYASEKEVLWKCDDAGIREDESGDDDEDFEMVEPAFDGEMLENNFCEEDVEKESCGGGSQDDTRWKESSSQAGGNVVTGPEEILEERLQPEDFDIDTPFFTPGQFVADSVTETLEGERSALLLEQGKQTRFAQSVTEQVTLEAQELLRLFGIPYIVSPMEAEAQCAYLDITEQTQGTITDDSDIWLFGGKRMYKNFFNQNKHVELFSVDAIVSHFGLKRQQLINIALLCGSDYTAGLEGVGPVRALEIMGEFQGDDLDGLREFRKWWDRANKNPLIKETSKLRTRLRDLNVIKGFPSQAVVDAYMKPVVDESKETFSWGQPDLDLLRQFAKIKFGWSREKSDRTLEPMMKQLMSGQKQCRIYSYFQPEAVVPAKIAKSSRLEKALSRVQEGKRVQPVEMERRAHTPVEERPSKRVTRKQQSNNEKDKDATREEIIDNELKISKVKKKKTVEIEEKDHLKSKCVDGDEKLDKTLTEKEKCKALPVEVKQEVEMNEFEEEISDFNFGGKEESFKKSVEILGKGNKKWNKGGRVGKKESSKIPSLTLETNRKRKSGPKTSMKKAAGFRSSVCLSESSSDSDCEKEGKKRQMESRPMATKAIPYPSTEESSATRMKGVTSTPGPGRVKSPTENMRQEERAASLMKANALKLQSSKTLQRSDPGKEFSTRNAHNPSRGDANTLAHNIGNRKRRKMQEVDNVNDGEDSSESKMLGSDPTVVKPKSMAMSKDNKETLSSMKNHKENSLGEESHQSEDARDGLSAETEPQQVVKNPDVSLINAQTLKATLSYLNQRSHEKKQLLNVLKGSHQLNAVERRLEEEEKRERMKALMNRKKAEQKKNDDEVDNLEGKQLVSFEDMLGGVESEMLLKGRAADKSKAGFLGNRGKLEYSKASRKVESAKRPPRGLKDLSKTDSQKPISKSKSERSKTPTKKDSESEKATSQSQPKVDFEKPSTASQHRTRMRSMSDDDISSTIDYITELEEEEREKEMSESIGSDVKDERSHRSKCFDQPIKGTSRVPLTSGDVSKSEKFQNQLKHIHDSRSVKGHGYFSSSNFQKTEKLRGFAVAGKGKGIGKNRNGRKGGYSDKVESLEEPTTGIQASRGVTATEIQEYAQFTAEDLGSDFSDNEL